jgi:hypothetical protein
MARDLITHRLEKISKDVFEKYSSQITQIIGDKTGVYALYDEEDLYYVGKATDLKRRIKQHLKDRHFAQWTHFSLYIMKRAEYVNEIESILIRISSPKGNKVKPRGASDPGLKKLLRSLIMMKQREEIDSLFQRKSTKKSDTINGLKGLFKSSKVLVRTYKGKEYKAKLLKNGKIRYKNKVYASATASAKVITKRTSINGLEFWYVQDDNNNWVKLKKVK